MLKTTWNEEYFINSYKNAKTDSERNKIEQEIISFLYFNLHKFGIKLYDEDLRSDFILYVFPKIPHLLKKYDSKKSKLYTYFQSRLQFAFITFVKNIRVNETAKKITESEQQLEFDLQFYEHKADDRLCSFYDTVQINDYVYYANEKSPEYEKNTEEAERRIFLKNAYHKMSRENRKIFLLACRSCLFLDDYMIHKISEKINFDQNIFFELIENFKTECKKKKMNMNKLISMRNKFYIRMNVVKEILNNSEKNCSAYKIAEKSYKSNYNAWKRTLDMSLRQQKSPTVKVIAKKLQLYEGTVEKNLLKALRKWDIKNKAVSNDNI